MSANGEPIDEKFRYYKFGAMRAGGMSVSIGTCEITGNDCTDPDCKFCFVPQRFSKKSDH